MRKVLYTILWIGIFSTLSLNSFAQLTFNVESATVNCEEQNLIPIDISVENFNNIGNMQYAIVWDTAVLHFNNVTHQLPPSVLIAQDDVANGELRIGWIDATSPFTGESISDDTDIITIFFSKNGGAGSTTEIDLVGLTGFPFQIADGGGQIISNNQIVINKGTISVFDNVAPIISGCPTDINLQIAAGFSNAVATWTAPTANDNCNVNMTNNFDSGDSFPVGTTTVTYTATDDGNNQITCDFNVTVTQVSNPGATGFELETESLSCTNDSVTIDITVANFNNLSSFQFGVEWDLSVLKYRRHLDFMPPATAFFEAHPDSSNLGIRWSDFNFPIGENISDGTVIVSLVFDLVGSGGSNTSIKFIDLPQFPIEVTENGTALPAADFMMMDGGVMVTDSQAPTFTGCLMDMTVLTPFGSTSETVSWTPPVANDNCNVAGVTNNFNSGDTFPVGTTTVIYTATDDAGGSATCTFDIIVQEDQLAGVPTFKLDELSQDCSADSITVDITVQDFNDLSSFQFMVGWDLSVLRYRNHLDFMPPATTYFEEHPDSANISIRWADFNLPVGETIADSTVIISLVFDIVGTMGDSSFVRFEGTPAFPVEVTKNSVPLGTNDFSVNDGYVNLKDGENPSIDKCPLDMAVVTAANNCSMNVNWDEPVATDDCVPNPSLINISGINSGDVFSIGSTEVVYVASDGYNTDTCRFTVSVSDAVMPTLTCRTDTTLSVMTTPVSVSNLGLLAAADNCGAVDTTFAITGVTSLSGNNDASTTSFEEGMSTVTYTVEDGSGNMESCSFVVTVDIDNPVVVVEIECPANDTIDTDPGQCTASLNGLGLQVLMGASSLVDTIFTMQGATIGTGSFDASGSQFNRGITTVTYNVANAAGDNTNCSFEVVVEDNEFPVIANCPSDMTMAADPATCMGVFNWTLPTVSDNCGLISYIETHQPNAQFPPGEREVFYIATDTTGNVEICSFKVTVEDNSSPFFTMCPADIEVSVDGSVLDDPDGIVLFSATSSCDASQIFFAPPAFIDTCGFSRLTKTDVSGFNSGSFFPEGTHTMIYEAADAVGNNAICQFDITVSPLPALNAGAINTFLCEGETLELAVPFNSFNYTYSWVGPNMLNTNVQNPTKSNVTTADAGVYTVTASAAMGCTIEETVTISIFEKPDISIDNNDVLCADGSNDLNLMGINASSIAIKAWTWRGPNGFNDTRQNPEIQNVTVANSGTYELIACSIDGCTDTASVNINISSAPIMPTVATDDGQSEYCAGATVDFTGSSLSGNVVDYSWEVLPTTGVTIPGANANALAITFNDAGVYTVRYSGTVDGCASAVAEMMIVINDSPSIALTSNAPLLCSDGMTDLELFVNGSADAFSWTGPNMFAATNKNPIIPNATAANAGTYILTATNGTSCSTVDSIVVQVSEGPSPVLPGITSLDTDLCLGETSTLIGDEYVSNSGVVYKWISTQVGSGVSTVINSRFAVVTPTQPGTFTYKYVVEIAGCPTDTATIDVIVSDQPTVNATYNDPLTCISDGVDLELSENGGSATSWSWTGPNGFTSTDQNPIIENVLSNASGTYEVTIENAGGCKATGTVDVVITEGLGAFQVMTNKTEFCEDTDSLVLETVLLPGATYSWSGPVVINNTSNRIVIQNPSDLHSGCYNVVVTTADGCTSPVSDDVCVEILQAPEAVSEYVLVLFETTWDFNVLGNDTFNANRPLTITAITQPTKGVLENMKDGTFRYTPNNDQLKEDFFTYEICYEDCDMLCSRAVVTIDIKHDPNQCVIPSVITPNGDGKNDVLEISCIEALTFPDNEIYIYSEWGDEIFHAAPYNDEWDGTYKGKPVPDGTYYYIFFRTPGSQPQKGFITVFR